MKKLESNEIKNLNARYYFSIFLLIILITNLAILLNIPLLRQISGFLFLTLLPGLLIIRILRLNKIDFFEKLILAWGISISFLMLFGLLVNNLSLSLGYETPLSTISLLISFNITFIVLGVIGCKINKEPIFSLPNLNLTTSEKAFLIVPILFPTLSIFGMHILNTTDSNIILMFLLFLIPIYVINVCFFDRKFPNRLYPAVIFLISISLLLLLPLRSNHLIGADVHTEYYYFQMTLDKLHWSIMEYSTLDACLSISLLPTIYQSILNMPTEFLYKILHSVLCSVLPVIIYVIAKKYVKEGYAFLASMYFMSNHVFFWTGFNARANTAILFFAFAMMVLFNDRIEPLKKRILFIIFMAACMVSHYTNTYIFFFVMLGTLVGMEILSKKYHFKKVISLTLVILFFAMIFFWYSQVTETTFNVGISFISSTTRSLNDFFLMEMRSGPAQTLLGEGVVQENIVTRIHWILTWITFAFIGIGVVTLIRRYKEMSFPEWNFKKPDFLKDKFEVVYFVLVLVCSGLLVAILAIPHLSKGYGLGRSYPFASTILAVFFVIGGIILSKHFFFLLKKTCAKRKDNRFFCKVFFSKEGFEGKNGSQGRAYFIILLVLIPYFLCITGVMCNISGDRDSIILNSEGGGYEWAYVHDQESCALKWFGNYAHVKGQKIYLAGFQGYGRVRSQGGIRKESVDTGSFSADKEITGYIYLGYYNIIYGKVRDSTGAHFMSEYSDKFVGKKRIYDNGGSEVWR